MIDTGDRVYVVQRGTRIEGEVIATIYHRDPAKWIHTVHWDDGDVTQERPSDITERTQ